MASNSKVLRLFSTPVVLAEVDEAEALNAALEAAILERKAQDPGVVRSNVGGWHSKPDLLAWAGDAGRKVARAVSELANAHTNDARGKPANVNWRVEAWANVSGAGHSNAQHIHGGCYWSAVYYVRAEPSTSGHLLLHDPRMPALRMHAPGLRLKDAGPELIARVRPQAGQIVLFPSWLAHSVEASDGESERISIALNLSLPPAGRRRAVAAQVPTQS